MSESDQQDEYEDEEDELLKEDYNIVSEFQFYAKGGSSNFLSRGSTFLTAG